jgi:hypothetical protein
MKRKLLPFIVIFITWFIFAAPFFTQGKTPFPSTYQVNFFGPWSTYSELGGPVKNNAQPDIITQIYPWRYFDIQELKKGQLALWNPYSFGGTPHLANYQSAVLFPLNLLFLLPFSFIDVWSFLVLLQPLLAGIGIYLFTRKLTVSSTGSILSAFSFMFCGFIVTWMGYATLGYAILPLPFALYSIEQYFSFERKKWLIALSLTFLFSFFAGHFQTSLYFSAVVFSYIIYHFIFFKNKRLCIDMFLFSIFGLLIAMPQVIPSIEFYTLSLRSILFQKVEAVPLRYFPTLLAPDFYGNAVTRNDWFGHYAEWNSYSGIIVLFLGFVTVFYHRTKKTMFFLLLAVLSLLLSFDTPVLSLIISLKIPVLSTSAASRILVLFSFSVAVLGGFGFDRLLALLKKDKRKVIIWGAFSLLVLLIVMICAFVPILMPSDKLTIARKNIILPAGLLAAFIAMVSFSLFSKNKRIFILFSIVTIILSGFEMYRFANKWQSFDPQNLVFKDVPTTDYYSKDFGSGRFFGDFTAENAVYYGLQSLNGYDPLYPDRYGEFIYSLINGKVNSGERSVVTVPKSGKYTPMAINLLGVKYFIRKVSDINTPWDFPYSKYPSSQFTKIYDDSHYQVFRNNSSYDRAFVVGKVDVRTNKQDILNDMFSSDLGKSAIIEEKIDVSLNSSKANAKVISYTPNKVTIKTSSNGNALLVLTDNFYPGWRAYVDGSPAKIYRTDYTFRGVVIPEGQSTIEFVYRPQSFLVGVYLFLIGILGMVTFIISRVFTAKR